MAAMAIIGLAVIVRHMTVGLGHEGSLAHSGFLPSLSNCCLPGDVAASTKRSAGGQTLLDARLIAAEVDTPS